MITRGTNPEGDQEVQIKVGKLRPSQIITTFGPGSVVDFPNDSVMIAGIDEWPMGTVLHEPRLEDALKLEEFRAPSMRKFGGDIPGTAFPKNRVCSNFECGRFSTQKKCPECASRTYPARLITVCGNNHADEFPWRWWVHRKNRCENPQLRLISQQKTASLADLIVYCDTCKRGKSLSGALGPKGLEGYSCRGTRPWLPGVPNQSCGERPRSVLRGASNVYFSSILSALSIPPWSNPIHEIVNRYWIALKNVSENTRISIIKDSKDFAGFDEKLVLQAIQDRMNNTATLLSLRKEEYLAFQNPGKGIDSQNFRIQREEVPDAFKNKIAKVVLASRLREVRVLHGFTRIDPPDTEAGSSGLAAISSASPKWLPAIEHRGEGIFIELAEDQVARWEMKPEVQERINELQQVYWHWREQRKLEGTPAILPRFVLLHTLAHLLIRQLSLECGYSSSALRERVYFGEDMCGLLIYTASADSDGSLGGLVQQGQIARLGNTMAALLDNAQWCSSDPLCAEHSPSKTGKLNGAACHACSLLSETSCECGNRFLDRSFVCDLAEVQGTGFFN